LLENIDQLLCLSLPRLFFRKKTENRYDGWSYEEIMLEPIARSILPFLSPAKGRKGFLHRVDFGLQVLTNQNALLRYSSLIFKQDDCLQG
jgi:hypothetical protein